jgi:hypothetical protein
MRMRLLADLKVCYDLGSRCSCDLQLWKYVATRTQQSMSVLASVMACYNYDAT